MRTLFQKVTKMGQTKYYDIGFNLTDGMYQGWYNGKKYHESDIKEVLSRCRDTNVENIMVTGSSIAESRECVDLCGKYGSFQEGPKLFYTIGVHPCSVNEFVPRGAESKDDGKGNAVAFKVTDPRFSEKKLGELYELIDNQSKNDEMFRAIGEIGLDYDRFHYSSKEIQLLFFEEQLKLSCFFAEKPLFLHMRSCSEDFLAILKKFINGFVDDKDEFKLGKYMKSNSEESYPQRINETGIFYKFSSKRKFVVHSFTGLTKDLEEILQCSKNCYVSVNGCSMKSEENIEMVKSIPVGRLLLETDAPWCDIRRSHASYKYLNSKADADVKDPWDNGLSDAYPQLEQWFGSVKRDGLVKKPVENWKNLMIKSRNEPCTMGHVVTAVANIKQMPLDELAEIVWKNSCEVYGE